MPDQPIDSQTIDRARTECVFQKLPILFLLELLAATLLFNFVVLFSNNYSSLIFLWLSAAVVLCVARVFMARLFSRRELYQDNYSLHNSFTYISILLSAGIWGTTWVMLPPEVMDPPRGALILWPCAMMAVAASSIAVKKSLYFSFSLPIVILHTLVILPAGTDIAIRYTVGLASFFIFVSILALRSHKDSTAAIILNLKNLALQRSLAEEEIKLETQSKTLLAHIQRERELLEEKKQADQQLAMANAEKLQLLDSVGEGIFGTNSLGCITFVNNKALNLLGYTEQEVIGQDALKLICESNSEDGLEANTRNAILDCFHRNEAVSSMRGLFAGKGDIPLPVTFSCQPIFQEEILVGTVVSFFDISDQLNMESQLLRSQKMEAIGRITGGVAHDFNNLLTVLQGNLQFLKKRISQREKTDDNGELDLIENMLTATHSGAELNNRLLTYSREQALESTRQDINTILEDMHRFVGRTLGEDIELVLDLCEPSASVMIDKSQFENVILNICMNARDAMPDGGTLTFQTSHVELDEDPHRLSGLPAGNYLELIIRDTGVGIKPELQEKIFDPFFTTKEHGEGSGFGLSTAFGFMQQSGGSIAVRSREGEGATFILHLPLIENSDSGQGRDVGATNRSKTYHGTLLVVEDDRQVRDIACMALMDAGYKVIVAENGRTGLDKIHSFPGIDLVFSDIVMPGGMTGIEMAEKILRQRPGMKILLATGYTNKALKDSVAGNANISCISKPYDFDQLPDLIDSMIHTAA